MYIEMKRGKRAEQHSLWKTRDYFLADAATSRWQQKVTAPDKYPDT